MGSHQSQPKGNRNKAITIAMPTGGSTEVSGEDADQAMVTASAMRDSSLSTHPEDNLPPLLALPSIWACPKVTKGLQGKKGKNNAWKCGWCGGLFAPDHATRGIYHLAQQPGGRIQMCPFPIDAFPKGRFPVYGRKLICVAQHRCSKR